MLHITEHWLPGIVPQACEKIFAQRIIEKRLKQKATTAEARELHEAKQLSWKILLNTIYGYIGMDTGFSYVVVAASVTAGCQHSLRETIRVIEEKGHRVIYGDTDSVFVIFNLPSELTEKGDKRDILTYIVKQSVELATYITKDAGIFVDPMNLEYEKTYPYLYIGDAKKKYVGYHVELYDKEKDPRKDEPEDGRVFSDLFASAKGEQKVEAKGFQYVLIRS